MTPIINLVADVQTLRNSLGQHFLKKRRHLFNEYEEKRLALKILQRLNPSDVRVQQSMADLPTNSSKTRIRNRCILTGRARSVWRAFRVSRIQLRKLASEGFLPGVSKYSW